MSGDEERINENARFKIESVGGNGGVSLTFVEEEGPEGGIVEVLVLLARRELCGDTNLGEAGVVSEGSREDRGEDGGAHDGNWSVE